MAANGLHTLPRGCAVLGALLLSLLPSLAPPAVGQEAARPLRDVIDEQVAAGWQTRGVKPAEPASDAEFLRRVTLDLNGTIPSAEAARKFLDDPAADKRQRLVDTLLASDEYARHMQHLFDVMLTERQYANYVTDQEWREYLRSSFAANKPWDQLVRELVGADGADPAIRPAIRFLNVRTIDSYRVLSPTMITRDLGRLLLGVNLQCAQCHDHPTISDYKQADYYGILAYVNRAHFVQVKVNDKDTMMIGEKAEGVAKFTSVFDAEKKENVTGPRLPGGQELPEPKFNPGEEYKVKPADGVVPVPAFSPRTHLMTALTSPENPAFKRNIANRLWQMVFGRGLVHPPDLHHGENPASHPELMTILADRFAADKFNIKNFLRELVSSKTYQLSSVPPATPAGTPPPPEAFAWVSPRAMRPEQFAFALMQATGLTDVQRAGLGNGATEPALYNILQGNLKPYLDLFARPPGQAENGFEPSLFQALFLANHGVPAALIEAKPQQLIERLSKLPEAPALADELYLSVYTRRPEPDEIEMVAKHLQGRDADRVAALQELVWAMTASAEFRFQH